MAKVLLLGESWMVYSVHQKGFDAFYTSEYTEGGQVFIDALRSKGHQVDYIPSHLIDTKLPADPAELAEWDVIAISDVGANTFQLPGVTFGASVPSPDKSESVRAYVEQGGAVLMIGGYLTFSGIDAKARWGRTPLAAALPVQVLDIDDRVERPSGIVPSMAGGDHPVTAGLPETWPALLGLNEIVVRPEATLLAEAAGYPLLVVGEYGAGRSAAFASDIAPHWAPPAFVEWPGYAQLFDQLVRWLARHDQAAD